MQGQGNSKYISDVLEYLPAPGQHINRSFPTPEMSDTKEHALQFAKDCLIGKTSSVVGLGSFGGYVIFKFDHPVVNVKGEYDLKGFGNAFVNNSEPGIVSVCQDLNKNGKPDADEPWYELAGSEYSAEGTIHNYTVTYTRPEGKKQPVPWVDGDGKTGTVKHISYAAQDYMYPIWIEENTITFTGTKLKNNVIKKQFYELPAYAWGYIDNWPNNEPIEKTGFKLDWAKDKDGNSVKLYTVDFIKVHSAMLQEAGWLGETSTEFSGMEDLHPDAVSEIIDYVPEDFTNDILLNTHFREMKVNDTYQIVARRVPEIIDNPIANNVTLPGFKFEIIKGNSVTVTNVGLVTAKSLGTSIIKVTYGPKEYNGNTYPAISPVNVSYMAVDVLDNIDDNPIKITTDITTRDYDTHYFIGSDTTFTFTPTVEGGTISSVKCNDENATVSNGKYTVKLLNRSNIIEIIAKKDAVTRKLYYVIDARKVEVSVKNITNPDSAPAVGDKVQVSFHGITIPVPKLATIYNPQFQSSWGGEYTKVYYSNSVLGTLSSNVDLTQYDLATNNAIEFTVEAPGNYIFSNGYIKEYWWGSKLGAEKDMTGPGVPNYNAETQQNDFSTFPVFNFKVDGYAPAIFNDILLEPNSVKYTSKEGLAEGESKEYNYKSGSFDFKTNVKIWQGGISSWYGIAVSNKIDNVTPGGHKNQFNSAAGGDITGIGNYGVVFEAASGGFGNVENVGFVNGDYPEGKPISGMYVCPNTYLTNSVLNGDGFGKKFGGADGNDKDWYKLIVTGYDKELNETGSVEMYIADYRFENNTQDYLLTDWTWLDLTPLGDKVKSVKFKLTSSDVGAYGMNTPAYFCLDNVNYKLLYTAKNIEDINATKSTETFSVDLSKVFKNTQSKKVNKSIVYNTNEQIVKAEIDGDKLNISFNKNQSGEAVIKLKGVVDKMAAFATVNVKLTVSTGIYDIYDKDINVYPNPADNTISINASGNVTIYSANGYLVKSVNNYSTNEIIDISSLTKGVYLVKINTNNSSKTIKVIKK